MNRFQSVSLRRPVLPKHSPFPLSPALLPGLCAAVLGAWVAAPSQALGCACGCGVFDVGTSSMFPTEQGGMVFVEYDYQDQNRNWSNGSRAVPDNNSDKEIETHFVTVGFQYLFNQSWGVQVEAPYVYRSFTTQPADPPPTKLSWGDLGDLRIKGIYTGFSPDLSTGVTFGFKLPTGNYTWNDAAGDVDRDTEIGSGSTDLLLGAFHRHNLFGGSFVGFVQGQADLPLLTRDQYRPGFEIDASAGLYYRGWSLGGVSLRPVAQVVGSERTHDCGANASPQDSGYQRVLLAPGFEVDAHPLRVFADVGFPVYQHVTGNQLVAPTLFKLVASYMF